MSTSNYLSNVFWHLVSSSADNFQTKSHFEHLHQFHKAPYSHICWSISKKHLLILWPTWLDGWKLVPICLLLKCLLLLLSRGGGRWGGGEVWEGRGEVGVQWLVAKQVRPIWSRCGRLQVIDDQHTNHPLGLKNLVKTCVRKSERFIETISHNFDAHLFSYKTGESGRNPTPLSKQGKC